MTHKKILESWNRIKDVVIKTPLEFNQRLSKKYNCNVYLKREDLQVTRSFKIRGSFNKISKMVDKSEKLICASAGNHAQGVAYSCNKLNLEGHIFVPEQTSLQKINRIKYFGEDNIDLKIIGKNFDDCLENAYKFQEEHGGKFIHPFDDMDIIYGQGTIGLEIKEELDPDILICPVGGGGLISGITMFLKDNHIKIYGTEPSLAPSLSEAFIQKQPIKLPNINTFVDGASVAQIGLNNYNILDNNLEDIFKINNGEVCCEMLELYQNDGIIAEPAGALPICALNKIDNIEGKNVVCILSGGNNDLSRYPEIIEKALIYEGKKHYFIIQFKQKPGELKNFVNNILNQGDNITRFEYIKKTNKDYGDVIVGIEIAEKGNIYKIIKKMNLFNYKFKKLEEDDLIYSYII
jgi:threonine dehydratase